MPITARLPCFGLGWIKSQLMAGRASLETNLVGATLGHYRVLERIGAGGMGEVYRARDEHLQRDVALKILAAGALGDDLARQRFRGEALALSELDHPNIATVHDFDTQEGVDFLVTEYVPGPTLQELLAAGAMPESEILRLGGQLAQGLAAAHGKSLVHRDLKPANLKVTPDGRLKILDFGLARKITVPELTASSTQQQISGTFLFMSPEQLQGGRVDARSDLYSAGLLLYVMATGRHPFREGSIAALVEDVLHRAPLPPRSLRPELSPRLQELILKCLEKDPERRYQSARELEVDLSRAAAGSAEEKAIAVLYFENLSGRKEDEYFRDGITEDITTELAKIRELKVFSRSAVLAYRDRPVTPAHMGQQLNASHVLEGSLRREGERLRITAKLVETRTGHALWAERFDRHLQDVFAIQDEIAGSIARALRVVLTEGEKRAIEKVPTADVRAYDLYLRGRQFFHQFRRRGFDFARQMFARAIEIDARYARAYAGIADCCAFLYMYWESSEGNLDEAEAASKKALDLDPELAEARASRGLVASLRKRYEEARQEFDAALRLDPKLFEAYYYYGRSYYAQGELAKAASWFERASQVRPEDYQAPMLLASALRGMGRAAESEMACRRGLAAAEKHLELYPGDARALYFGANGLSYFDRERALNWAGRALQVDPDEPQVLYNVACVYALLGELEPAIDCLEKSLTKGWGQKQWMASDPDLAPLRAHPRFQALLR